MSLKDTNYTYDNSMNYESDESEGLPIIKLIVQILLLAPLFTTTLILILFSNLDVYIKISFIIVAFSAILFILIIFNSKLRQKRKSDPLLIE